MITIKDEIKQAVAEALDERKAATKRNLVTGLQGLANLLNVSYSTAYRIKRSKVLAKATFQVNRTIVFDAYLIKLISLSFLLPWLSPRMECLFHL